MRTHHSTDHPKKPSGGVGPALILTVVAFSILTWGLISTRAAETVKAPDTISLSEYNRTAGTVTFIHKDHGATGSEKPGCADCHHTSTRDQIPPKCSVCHEQFSSTDTPTDSVAFHLLCIGCHKSEIESGNRRIDLACDSCHMPER